MGLRHWWPLTGDLDDRIGNNPLRFLSGYNNGYIVSNSAGKFGACYERTAVAKVDFLRSTNTIGPFTEESLCCWVLITQHAALNTANGIVTHHNHDTNSGLGIGMFTTDGVNYFTSVNAGTGSGRIHSNANYRGSTNLKGEWHHICLTYAADGKIRMYVDGKEDMTARAYALHNTADYLDLFNWSTGHYTNTSYRPVCKLNDVRIYDHALSAAEVQELAKGLALHYTFNQGYTPNYCNWKNPSTCATTGWSGGITYNDEVLTLTATNGWRSFMWNVGDSNVGKPVTFSYEYKVIDATNAGYLYIQNHTTSGYGASIQDLSLDAYDWVSGSVTVASANKYIGFNVRGTDDTGLNFIIQVRNLKIALNDYDTIYSDYDVVNQLCSDDSGFEHNGIASEITYSTDAKRGSLAVVFNGTKSYIEAPNFKPNFPNEEYTISFWINPKENAVRDIIFGNHANSTHTFNIERHTGNQLRVYYQGDTIGFIPAATMPANEWTHIVIVRAANNVFEIWHNGSKIVNATYAVPTLTITSPCYKLGSDYRTAATSNESTRLNGLLDDFRIYMTALDEEAIRDLYEPAIYMTNNDVLMAGEFICDDEINMTNTGIISAVEFYEEIYKSYERLEYLESNKTQYINIGYTPIIDDITVELDMMWTGTTISNFESFAGFMHSSTIPRLGLHNYSSVLMFGANATTNSTVAPITNKRMIYTGHFKSGDQKLYKNGQLIASNKNTFDFSSNTQAMYLFGRNASSQNLAAMRLYTGKIYERDRLIRDLIPVRRKTDNVLGLYDIVTGAFYAGSGSGTFIAGPTVSNDKISMYTSNKISAKEILEF